ncbi:hypothetical protein ANCCAN_30125 [Ancylostoma caninum]|uniref:Uncharacterized protein n=1 Tax=Ancylostoma caninum TaxID=29170 RepID=A0A368EZS6_ANCCA|nr:hypothetical protein ANCCAN_30125 [Ancylostoma caninum]
MMLKPALQATPTMVQMQLWRNILSPLVEVLLRLVPAIRELPLLMT